MSLLLFIISLKARSPSSTVPAVSIPTVTVILSPLILIIMIVITIIITIITMTVIIIIIINIQRAPQLDAPGTIGPGRERRHGVRCPADPEPTLVESESSGPERAAGDSEWARNVSR